MINNLAGPAATPVSGRERVLHAVGKKKSFEEARERSRTKRRYRKKPNLSGTALAGQFGQVLRGFRGTTDGAASCLAYEDLTRQRDKEAVQAGISRLFYPCGDPRGPGQFIVDAISCLPLSGQRQVLSKVCTSKLLDLWPWL
jgi:hypothetical protein